jgi:hypothetical protein
MNSGGILSPVSRPAKPVEENRPGHRCRHFPKRFAPGPGGVAGALFQACDPFAVGQGLSGPTVSGLFKTGISLQFNKSVICNLIKVSYS